MVFPVYKTKIGPPSNEPNVALFLPSQQPAPVATQSNFAATSLTVPSPYGLPTWLVLGNTVG